MNQEKLWLEFSTLSPQAQNLIIELIAFMQKGKDQVFSQESASSLAKEAFIGMWQDRDDLVDSSEWVRETRQQEWGKSF